MKKSHPLKFVLDICGEGLDQHYVLLGLRIYDETRPWHHAGNTTTVLKLKLSNDEPEAQLLRSALEVVQPEVIPSPNDLDHRV